MKRRINRRRAEALKGLAYAAAPLTGMAVFFGVPFGISVVKTFYGGVGGHYFSGFANYISLFESEAFRLALRNTLKFIGISVPLILALAFVLALALNSGIKGKTFFRTLFVLPLVVPVASVILVFQILFERAGALNYALISAGLEPSDWLHSESAFGILVILYVWKNCGYHIVLFLAGLAQIPQEYDDAAKSDGAGRFRATLFITLPLMVPQIFFNVVIGIVNAFKVFREAYALGGQYPHESIYMLQHFMNNNFYNLNYPRLSVSSLLTFAVILSLVLVMFGFRRKAGDHQL